VCPHRFKTPCACKKPQPTLYLQAAQDWDIDPLHSYVFGDTLDDIRAGQAVGAKTAFVRTGWALRYLDEHGHEADFIGEDMLAVANWIVQAN
jgi:D-glycero-D-manno-heptose 1,7-bisphosphate phosphatase